MNRITVALLLIILLPSFAFAGEVYGSIEVDGRSVGAGVGVDITCGNHVPYATVTDRYGSYSIYVNDTGNCRLTVHYASQPQIDVYSYPSSVRYDLVLQGNGGQYSLKRK